MVGIVQVDNAAKTICWARGDTDPKSFLITSAVGVVEDISGWTFILTVNSQQDPADITSQLFAITGVFQTDGTDGLIVFTPAINDTDLTPETYYYDIERRIGGINIKTLVKATVLIVQDISKG